KGAFALNLLPVQQYKQQAGQGDQGKQGYSPLEQPKGRPPVAYIGQVKEGRNQRNALPILHIGHNQVFGNAVSEQDQTGSKHIEQQPSPFPVFSASIFLYPGRFSLLYQASSAGLLEVPNWATSSHALS